MAQFCIYMFVIYYEHRSVRSLPKESACFLVFTYVGIELDARTSFDILARAKGQRRG